MWNSILRNAKHMGLSQCYVFRFYILYSMLHFIRLLLWSEKNQYYISRILSTKKSLFVKKSLLSFFLFLFFYQNVFGNQEQLMNQHNEKWITYYIVQSKCLAFNNQIHFLAHLSPIHLEGWAKKDEIWAEKEILQM